MELNGQEKTPQGLEQEAKGYSLAFFTSSLMTLQFLRPFSSCRQLHKTANCFLGLAV
jgi:hypothetical protein